MQVAQRAQLRPGRRLELDDHEMRKLDGESPADPVAAYLGVPFEIGVHGNALTPVGAFEILSAVLAQEDGRAPAREYFTVLRWQCRFSRSMPPVVATSTMFARSGFLGTCRCATDSSSSALWMMLSV